MAFDACCVVVELMAAVATGVVEVGETGSLRRVVVMVSVWLQWTVVAVDLLELVLCVQWAPSFGGWQLAMVVSSVVPALPNGVGELVLV